MDTEIELALKKYTDNRNYPGVTFPEISDYTHSKTFEKGADAIRDHVIATHIRNRTEPQDTRMIFVETSLSRYTREKDGTLHKDYFKDVPTSAKLYVKTEKSELYVRLFLARISPIYDPDQGKFNEKKMEIVKENIRSFKKLFATPFNKSNKKEIIEIARMILRKIGISTEEVEEFYTEHKDEIFKSFWKVAEEPFPDRTIAKTINEVIDKTYQKYNIPTAKLKEMGYEIVPKNLIMRRLKQAVLDSPELPEDDTIKEMM